MSDNWIQSKICNTKEWVRGITVDNIGNIYYTTNNENIYLVSKDNNNINTESQILINIKGAMLYGIVWNRNNILYICDSNNHEIHSYSIDTRNLSTLAGNGEEGHKDGNMKEAQFNYPSGITMDKNGDLYITDEHHVRKINLSKETVETIAGSIDEGYNDGNTMNAKFNFPIGISMSDDDTIYVADCYNECIRKIKNGIVSTIAGIPEKEGYEDGSLNHSKFSDPFGIVLNDDGNLLVCDLNGLRRIDMNQNIVSTLIKQQGIRALSKDKYGNIYVGIKNSILKLEINTWKWERFLWIGWMKEKSNYCLLASLPKDIIHEIISHINPNKRRFRK
jgi:DNA-binding beta-propeller fold protein YncE